MEWVRFYWRGGRCIDSSCKLQVEGCRLGRPTINVSKLLEELTVFD
jgi:hypothetical protein